MVQGKFIRKNRVVYRDKGYFRRNQKVMTKNWKCQWKNNPLGKSDILRNKRIA